MNVMAKSNRTLTQSGLLEVLLKHQRRKVILLARRPTPFFFTHIKRVAAIIVALSFLLVGLWFGVSTHRAPPPSYPYYDTQKPVPPWSEPAPLEGNRNTGGDYK